MEFGSRMLHFVGICILLSFVRTSYALDCYACNVSTSTLDEDGCYGIGSIKKCGSNSVCLSASYEINTGSVKTYTTMQSCFPNMADQECEYFIKSQKDLQRTATITPKTCYSCKSDNCNRSKSKPNHGSTRKVGTVPVIAGIFALCIAKLIML